ncbi:WSC domain-containing protein [Hypomontagnella monticulosa]|nr:WSC domain-containing protein [Hypomontagnella monticulosa]
MTSRLASIIIALAAFTSTIRAIEYVGCFGPPSDFEYDGRHIFQSVGRCNQVCSTLDFPVLAVSNGTNCFCSHAIPPPDRAVEESLCNSPCAGYAMQMCGGRGFFSVYSELEMEEPPTVTHGEESSTQPVPAETGVALPEPPAEDTQVPLGDISEL